jgi:hypothetical protein
LGSISYTVTFGVEVLDGFLAVVDFVKFSSSMNLKQALLRNKLSGIIELSKFGLRPDLFIGDRGNFLASIRKKSIPKL